MFSRGNIRQDRPCNQPAFYVAKRLFRLKPATFRGVIQFRDVYGTQFAMQWSNNAPREISMNEQDLQTKLAELMGEISTLPVTERAKLEKLAEDTRVRHERLRQTVSSLQESLDYLRLSIKYLVFDLEATRRENGYLRKMLEEATETE
jgi:hypothetical protein